MLHQPLTIDWQQWQRELAKNGNEQAILQAFILAKHLLNAPIPQEFTDWIAKQDADKLVLDTLTTMRIDQLEWSNKNELNAARIGRIRNRLKLQRNLRHLMETFCGLWIEPRDWHDFPLPEKLFPLYYPLRPLFWLWRRYTPSSSLAVSE